DASLQVGRVKLRVGLEVQDRCAALLTAFSPEKSIGEKPQHLGGLIIVMLAALALLGLGSRVVDEAVHLSALLRLGKLLTITLEDTLNTGALSFSYPLLDGALWLVFGFVVHPVRVVVLARCQLGLDRLLHNLLGILRMNFESL